MSYWWSGIGLADAKMWAFIAPFLGKIIGFLALVAGLLAVYLGIKRKGTLEERGKWEAATAEAEVKLSEKVTEATSKDSEIDRRVEDEKKKLKETIRPPTDSNDTIFRF